MGHAIRFGLDAISKGRKGDLTGSAAMIDKDTGASNRPQA
jgi:hypothetical protein